MSEGLSNKISNIHGVVLPYPIRRQLHVRSQKSVSSNYNSPQFTDFKRDDENLLYIANKGAWVRLVSSIDIKKESDFLKFINQEGLGNGSTLAKTYVLYGGASKYSSDDESKKFSYDFRSGILGSYAPLGESEIQQYGYRPMPGITDVKITTMGKLGSTRSAVISLKVWDRAQLDIIDTLYFKLGYTMLLEWGHVMYYNNDAVPMLQRGENNLIDPFETGATKESINRQICKISRESAGNYDAMLGMCTKFNYSMNQDGGFDCTVELQALGTLADAMKINQPQALPGFLEYEVKVLVDIANTKILREEKQRLEAERAVELAKVQEAKADAAASVPPGKTIDQYLKDKGYDDMQLQNASYFSSIRGDNNDKIFLAGSKPTNGQAIQNVQFYSKTFAGGWEIKNGTSALQTEVGNAQLTGTKLLGNITSIKLKKELIESCLNYFIQESVNAGEKITLTSYGIHKDMTPKTNRSGDYDRIGRFIVADGGIGGKKVGMIEYDISNIPNIGNLNDNNVQARFALWAFEQSSKINSVATTNGIGYEDDNGMTHAVSFKPFPLEYNGNFFAFGIHESRQRVDSYGIPNMQIRKGDGQIETVSIDTGNANKYSLPYFQFYGIQEIFLWTEPTVKGTAFDTNLGQSIRIPYILTLFESGYIESIEFSTTAIPFEERLQKERQSRVSAIAEPPPIEDPASTAPTLNVADTQTEEARKYQSGLEIFLRSIQLHTLNSDQGRKLILNGQPDSSPLSLKNNGFIKNLFKNGIYSKIVNSTDDKNSIKTIANKIIESNAKDIDLMLSYAVRGFNHNLMKKDIGDFSGGDVTDSELSKYPVLDFDKLFTSYLYPYSINQGVIKGVDFNYPVYIPLGLLFMAINHMCTIYDSPATEPDKNTGEIKALSANQQKPLIYLDFNPETNFCMSEPLQMTMDPYKFLIPFNGTLAGYKKLFDEDVIKSVEQEGIFNPETDNVASAPIVKMHPYKDQSCPYRAKIMNALVNIDYLLKLCENFANRDSSQSVHLMPFLNQLVSDMNKSFGDINVFRVAYDDYSNCLFIVDDQFIKLDDPNQYVQTYMAKEYEGKSSPVLPLYGMDSIAKSLEIKTDISNKISNYIAICANSDIETDLSKDTTSLSTAGRNLRDRYITQRTSIAGSSANSGSKSDAKIKVAQEFDDFVTGIYSTGNLSEDRVPSAINYYIEKMSKRKGKAKATRAAAIIPISVNFSTDGIGGLAMGHSFLLPDSLLPASYRIAPEGSVVGFTILGLDHTIANNIWTTNIKAHMTYLKEDKQFEFVKEEFNINPSSQKSFSNINAVADLPTVDNSMGASTSNYPSVPSTYSNIKYGDIARLGNPKQDRINPNLLEDINRAAISSNVVVTITTAITGHKPTERHASGRAVDIAIIDGIAVRPNNKSTPLVNSFVNELVKLGYVKNRESGNPKAVLTYGFPNHDDHIHVSNKS